ncbi:MAG: hypothetical protein CM15mP49_35320 [Actinomycetota bacterium]|nr:MAG: hypothetical protein CM15mP49_35320 [Actinomycetota bacterium]
MTRLGRPLRPCHIRALLTPTVLWCGSHRHPFQTAKSSAHWITLWWGCHFGVGRPCGNEFLGLGIDYSQREKNSMKALMRSGLFKTYVSLMVTFFRMTMLGGTRPCGGVFPFGSVLVAAWKERVGKVTGYSDGCPGWTHTEIVEPFERADAGRSDKRRCRYIPGWAYLTGDGA